MSLLPQPLMNFGALLAFGSAYFTETGTTTPIVVYQDDIFSLPHVVPVVADENGVWPAIYLDPTLGDVRMRVIVNGGDLANPRFDVDPLNVLFGLGGVTNAYLADAPGGTLKGNLGGSTGPVTDNTQAEVSDFIRYATEDAQGVAQFATSAEATAGASTTVAVTPAGVKLYADAGDATLLAALKAVANLAGKGHIKIPTTDGVMIINWDTVTQADDTQGSHALDFAFPTVFLGAMVSVNWDGVRTGGNGGGATWAKDGLSHIKTTMQWDGDSTGIDQITYWAWGK